MAGAEKDLPIRVVKKKGGHGGHHGGAWKVAYADFVTAMMAFFIVMWIVGQSKPVKQAVAGYFKDPGVFESGKGGVMQGSGDGGTVKISIDDINKTKTSNSLSAQKAHLEEAAKAILNNMRNSPTLSKLAGQIEVQAVSEGLRMELVETSESFFFDVGTSRIQPDKEKVLAVIAEEVGKLPNKVAIEGHTDSRPYSRLDGYSNFELSSDRANAARRILTAHGLRPEQVDEIRGYADTRLKKADNPLADINRRISILIKYDFADIKQDEPAGDEKPAPDGKPDVAETNPDEKKAGDKPE